MDARRIAEMRELEMGEDAIAECLDEIERLRRALQQAHRETGCCYVCREREHAPGCPLAD